MLKGHLPRFKYHQVWINMLAGVWTRDVDQGQRHVVYLVIVYKSV